MLVLWIVVGVLVLTFAILLWLKHFGPAPAADVPRSPVPWLSDAVWRDLHPRGYLSRRGAGGRALIFSPDLVQTTEADRVRAPLAPDALDPGELPPEDELASLRQHLLGTPGSGTINLAVWPVCCRRLATLISRQGRGQRLDDIESYVGSLDRAFLEGELIRWGGPGADQAPMFQKGWSEVLGQMRLGEHTGIGIHVYHCRHCHRVYVASCAP